ncbi:MAG: DUF4397 domain-containing protein [Fimbriimonadaceae bacterium]|nr:DUF4397 domain-containing protein [Fimbriimonadaceae bacterium]
MARFFNGSSDSGPLDFWLNDDNKAPSISFDTATPAFEEVKPDELDVILNSAGVQDQLDALLFTFVKDKDYIIAALGLENYGSEPLKRLRLVVQEVNRKFINGNVSRLVIFHGYNRETGFETPEVDFQNPGSNPQFKVSEIAFAAAKTANITSGVQNFEVRTSGTENIIVTATHNLLPGKTYAVFILGQENGTGDFTPKVTFIELETRP